MGCIIDILIAQAWDAQIIILLIDLPVKPSEFEVFILKNLYTFFKLTLWCIRSKPTHLAQLIPLSSKIAHLKEDSNNMPVTNIIISHLEQVNVTGGERNPL